MLGGRRARGASRRPPVELRAGDDGSFLRADGPGNRTALAAAAVVAVAGA